MSIVTPKNAVEIVLVRKTKAPRFRPYDTAVQKWFFWSALVCFAVGGALGLAVYFWRQPIVAFFAVSLLLLSSLLSAGYQLALAVPEFLKLKNIEREVSSPFVTEFNDDIDLIAELARDHQSSHLVYARDSYSLMADQLRSRISLLVGAIDKVGIIPIGVTAYISGAKAFKDGLVVFSGVEWILAALIFLYLFALRMNATAQWMDRVSLLYKEAAEARRSDGG